MNKTNLENYAKDIEAKFSNKITKNYQNNNEIHFNVELNDMPKICDYVYKNLNARLAIMICSDERKNGMGFAIRYVFERDDVFIFIIVSKNSKLRRKRRLHQIIYSQFSFYR